MSTSEVERPIAEVERAGQSLVFVDVVVPVHNSAETIVQAVESAMCQMIPQHLCNFFRNTAIDVAVCCYDDGSSDNSWPLLCQMNEKFGGENAVGSDDVADATIPSRLIISQSDDGVARGAGYARNRAASLRGTLEENESTSYLCLLDSDDTMHEARVAEQLHALLSAGTEERCKILLGSTFTRDPPDSTWHYASWANGLSDERLSLERFREVSVIQPTWMISKSRFRSLGGYIEAPHPYQKDADISWPAKRYDSGILRLVHPTHDTPQTLRLAEDLRFFHAHLSDGGLLRLCRADAPLVTYRHRSGMSQSSHTSRKLLFQLRVLAFESTVLSVDPVWESFVIWGAGRDGKDFVKMLSKNARQRVICMVDVDEKKINAGYYANRELCIRIPIVHFSLLASDLEVRRRLQESWEDGSDELQSYGRIDKGRQPNGEAIMPSKATATSPRKRRRVSHTARDVDLDLLPTLPVVVCVAMYRTNGALEKNVKRIGRIEGKDLWHFC